MDNERGASDKSGEAEGKKNYLPGIDGLRAIAVLAVLLFHGGIATFGGGFLGVEVFFVVSGYLITLLMLRERESNGGIDVRGFWRRRARRLLPAAYVLIALVLLYALFAMPTELSRIRGDAIAALAYVINWTLIFADRPYFESMGRPSPLHHLWSLAVEEQFYLVWPIVLAGMLRFFRRREAAFLVLLMAAGSYALMAWMYNPEADPARVYYGTDTRAGALLLGAGLAFFWDPQRVALKGWMPTALAPLGPLALAALIWVFITTDASTTWLYPWGFVAASVATLATIFVATAPGANPLARCLSLAPMRWGGTRSYGLYLWHWPIFCVTRPGLDVNFDGLDLLIGRLALTALAAEISFRVIEQPFRSGAAWRGMRTLFSERPVQARVLAASGGFAALALFVSAFSASEEGNAASSPETFHGVVGIADVSVSLEPSTTPTIEPTATPTPEATATPSPEPTEEAAAAPPTPIPHTPTPPPPPPPTAAATAAPPPASNVGVLAIGDSVMLGAAPYMGVAGAVEVDAAVNRQSGAVLAIIRERAAAGTLPPVVVVHTGNNGPLTVSMADQIVEAAGGATVVFVTVRIDRSWESTTNNTVYAMPGRFGNARIADWREASGGHDEYFAADGIHLTRAGGEAYAATVAWAVN